MFVTLYSFRKTHWYLDNSAWKYSSPNLVRHLSLILDTLGSRILIGRQIFLSAGKSFLKTDFTSAYSSCSGKVLVSVALLLVLVLIALSLLEKV